MTNTRSVVSDHKIPAREPITITPGDRVQVGDADTTWPSFVFITTASGSGWVPERYLDGGRPQATVLSAYDTRELPVTAGELLSVIEDDPASGWSWCENKEGRTGWVPHSVLR